MKQTRPFLSLLMIAALTFCLGGCKDDEEETGTSSIAGYVSNANTGEPLRAVDITLSPKGLATVSGADGRYEFRNLEAGTYYVRASKAGYITNTITVVTAAEKTAVGDILLTPSSAEMSLSVSRIDFGVSGTVQNFNIINNAANGTIQWAITKQGTANWLTVSPTSGTTGAGQQSPVTLVVDRSLVQTTATVILEVTNITSGNTITLPVTVGYNSGTLQVTPNPVDFGTTATSRQLTLLNTGSTTVSYEVNYNCAWLTVSPTSGNLAPGNSAVLSLALNRSAFSGEAETILQVRNTADGSSTSVHVTASNTGGGSSDDIVVSNGLLAYYTFDDGTVNDRSDNGADGSFGNDAVTVSTGNGRYLKLTASQCSYINIPYNLFSGYTHWTVSFWVKDLSAGKIFAAQAAVSGGGYYDAPVLSATQDGYLAFRSTYGSWGSSFTAINYNYINNSSQWHHWVITMNGTGSGNIKFYVDGTLMSTVSASYSASTVSNCTQIMFGGDGSATCAGMKLDNIRFYGRTLSTSEIQTIYNNEIQ